MAAPPPRSCDTFVVLPESASGLPGCFGKNSDRPSEEEHEVVYIPRQQHPDGAMQQCTYIKVPQVRETLAVMLSKPRWLWGCEMGANECGVVGGNEAIWTRASGDLGSEERLLGMDILRLALERSSTAREAIAACASLLESHGQGGGCAEDDDGWTYENGFLFADSSEAFVMETAGVSWWAVERVPAGGSRNISNSVSLRTDLFDIHPGLKKHCQDKAWWDGTEPFDFKAVLTAASTTKALEPSGREAAGRTLLTALANDASSGNVPSGQVLAQRMMDILRHEDSGICFRDVHGFCSTGSQVSLLSGSELRSHTHFFTCASDPKVTAYKYFTFPETAPGADAAAQIGPRSLALWRAHRENALKRGRPLEVGDIEARAMHRCADDSTQAKGKDQENQNEGDPFQEKATLLELVDEELALFAGR